MFHHHNIFDSWQVIKYFSILTHKLVRKFFLIPFLDILVIWKKSSIDTKLYRKSTDTDIYFNWFSYAPNTWKGGTFNNLVNRAYNIYSTEYLFRKRLLHLEKMCIPVWLYNKKKNNMSHNNNDDSNTNNEK